MSLYAPSGRGAPVEKQNPPVSPAEPAWTHSPSAGPAPPPGSAEPFIPPAEPPEPAQTTHSPRRWPWVVLGALIAVVATLVALIALGLALGGAEDAGGPTDSTSLPSAPPTSAAPGGLDVAYVEDFSDGPGRFGEFDDPFGVARAVDGIYVLSNPVPWSATYAAAWVDASDTVDVRATMALRTKVGDGGYGITVLDDNEAGYLLTIIPGWGADISAKAAPDADWTTLLDNASPVPSSEAEVRLTVDVSASGTKIVGYVDGVRVIRYADEAAPYRQFSWIGAVAVSGEQPATIAVDSLEVLN